MSGDMTGSGINNDIYWGTPPEVVECVKRFLGTIDLDPASSSIFNWYVGAKRYYTEEDDGLSLPWNAERVFVNPPYGKEENGRSRMATWANKALEELQCGNTDVVVLLVLGTPSNIWFNRLSDRFPVCFPERRIRFIDAQGVQQPQPKKGNAIFMMTDPGRVPLSTRVEEFRQAMSPLGETLLPFWLARRLMVR